MTLTSTRIFRKEKGLAANDSAAILQKEDHGFRCEYQNSGITLTLDSACING